MTQLTKSIIVKATPTEAYAHWADFERFPQFMTFIKEVRPTGPHTSHWVLDAPAGMTVEWNAELTRMDPNQRIAWSTKGNDGDITTSGQVTFAELPQDETEITVTIQYSPPGGAVGEALARWFANPEERLETDLNNFKRMIESQRVS